MNRSATKLRNSFLLEHLTTGRRDAGGPSYCAVRSKKYKYVEYSTGERELYNLAIDRAEMKSRHRAPAYRSTLHRPRDRMLQLCRPSPPGWNPG